MHRWSFVALPTLVTAAAALLGCGGTWHVVTQAPSDPFAGQARFAVLPVDYSDLRVAGKTEQDYLDARDPKEPTTFADDKAGLEEGFAQALREEARAHGIAVVRGDSGGEAPFLIRPTVTSLDPGIFVPSRSSQVDMDVKIVTSDGRVLDEITVSHGTDPHSGDSSYGAPANATIGHRLHADGETIGTVVAQYLETRVGTVHGGSPSPEPEPAESSEPPPKPRAAPPPPPAPPPAPAPTPPPTTPPPAPTPPSRAPAGKVKPAPRAVKRPVPPAASRVKRPVEEPPPPPAGTPIATSPGFSRLEDGKTRIWVEVSRTVDVAENRSPGRVVYRLRGAAVLQRSDQLPLQTGFFTTPVDRVQIVPDGGDVDLVITLREDVVPSYRVVETPRGIVLQVDFPRSAAIGRDEAPAAPEPSRPRADRSGKTQTLGRRHERGAGAPPMDDN